MQTPAANSPGAETTSFTQKSAWSRPGPSGTITEPSGRGGGRHTADRVRGHRRPGPPSPSPPGLATALPELLGATQLPVPGGEEVTFALPDPPKASPEDERMPLRCGLFLASPPPAARDGNSLPPQALSGNAGNPLCVCGGGGRHPTSPSHLPLITFSIAAFPASVSGPVFLYISAPRRQRNAFAQCCGGWGPPPQTSRRESTPHPPPPRPLPPSVLPSLPGGVHWTLADFSPELLPAGSALPCAAPSQPREKCSVRPCAFAPTPVHRFAGVSAAGGLPSAFPWLGISEAGPPRGGYGGVTQNLLSSQHPPADLDWC